MDLDALRAKFKLALVGFGFAAMFALGFGAGWYAHAGSVAP